MTELSPLPDTPLGLYCHYKGGQYEVLGVARHSETLEPLVVYRPLYNATGLVGAAACDVLRGGGMWKASGVCSSRGPRSACRRRRPHRPRLGAARLRGAPQRAGDVAKNWQRGG